MLSLNSILNELYDKSTDVVASPEVKGKTFDEVLADFKHNGGRILGRGRNGTVLLSPKWNYVLKIFSDDVAYIKFTRFCLKNPRTSFPKILDKPRKIGSIFRKKHNSDPKYWYLIKLEKLEPIDINEYDAIEFYIRYKHKPFHSGDVTKVAEIESKYPKIIQFLKDYEFFIKHSHEMGDLDLVQENFMKRPNGEFVLSDPVGHADNPFAHFIK